MFTVSVKGDKLLCEMTETPPGHKLIQPMEMSCRIEMPLGIRPSKSAERALRDGMQKRFPDLVKKKSGGFLDDIGRKVAAIGKMLDDKDPQKAARARESDFLKREEDQIKTLWKNWSEKIAPRLANEALQEVVKSATAGDLDGIAAKKVKAVGRVTAVPALALASAVASGVTGNLPGAVAALGKAASAAMKVSEDLPAALNKFRQDKDAAARDIDTISAALKTVAGRIDAMKKHRKSIELRIAALATQTQAMAKELKAMKGADPKASAQIAAAIRANGNAMIAMKASLPDTDTMQDAWKKIAVEKKRMQDSVDGMASAEATSLKNVRDINDAVREILSIISKMV